MRKYTLVYTPRKKGTVGRTVRTENGRQLNKRFFVNISGCQRGVHSSEDAVMYCSEDKPGSIVTLNQDYDVKHWGRSMYSEGSKVSETGQMNMNRALLDTSRRFQEVLPSGKSRGVSLQHEVMLSSDDSDNGVYQHMTKGNNMLSNGNSTIAPMQMSRRTIHLDQQVPLRSWRCKGSKFYEHEEGSHFGQQGVTNRPISSGKQGYTLDQTINKSYTQPSMMYQYKGRQQGQDRLCSSEMGITGHNYNGRVMFPSTEGLSELPIRYKIADGNRSYWVTTTGKGVGKTNERGNRNQMSIRNSEKGKLRNSNGYSMGHSGNFYKDKRIPMWKGWILEDSDGSVGRTSVDVLNNTPSLVDKMCKSSINAEVEDSIVDWRRLGARKEIIDKRSRHLHDLQKTKLKVERRDEGRDKEEPPKRTTASVLQEVQGNSEPRWMRLNTDRVNGSQNSVGIAEGEVNPNSTSVVIDLLSQTKEFKLNPRAMCFVPKPTSEGKTALEETMMVEVEGNHTLNNEGYENAVKQEETTLSENTQVEEGDKEEVPLVWNLKGRSIDDILRDLDALKNDPNIPMPNIEADLALAEDFEQYTKCLGKDDCDGNDTPGDEISKDFACLESLKQLTGPVLEESRPRDFPKELWSFVLNDQKPLVMERWADYDKNMMPKLVADFLSELQVSEERPYAKPFFIAQALANIDRFVIKSKDGIPPLVHDKFTHRMELLPGTRVRKELPQRFSENQNAFLRAKLSILEEQGRIKQIEGLRKEDWLHRIVLVEHPTRMAAFRLKYGENTQEAMNNPTNRYEVSQLYRLTIDCREINKCLAVEPYPMPENSMGKENIIGSRYMSTSDAADAFYAVPIREIDYGKTGFTALGKQWVFTVMLQGGINSARHFARIITETFDGVPQSKILAFQDDALVHAKRLLQALLNQQLLYCRIRSNEIMLKPSKTRIGFSSCKFLGHIYTPMGRLPDPTRVESIINMDAKPKTQKEVRHIVGLLVWNIEYIPNGMGILSYLSDLIRKDADVVAGWKPEVQGKALNLLKAALASAPCLRPIDTKRPFRVHVDACKNGRGIGAVLLQEYKDKWRPCSYFSKALTPAQRQWSATELEAYALVSAARHWERYLQNGHKWTAIVDHKALIYLVVKRTRTNNTRLLNSVMCLQGHHFDILHRNGEEHFDADAVSRILHSGDIQDAQEAVDIEDDDDKAVTMKDIRLLNRLLQLQLLALANARGDSEVRMPMNPEVRGGSEGQVSLVEKFNKKFAKGAIRNDLNHSPLVLETNMVLTDKEPSSESKRIRHEPGLLEAQEKANQAKDRIRKQQDDLITSSSSSNQFMSASNVSTSGYRSEDNNPDQDVEEKDPDDNNLEEVDNHDDEEGRSCHEDDVGTEPRILVPIGPFRWTSTVIREFMKEYRFLEGKMLLHPRTGRLYEIGTVFFHEKLKIAAAYIRAIDGGQADPLDEHPHRIDGKGGLAELVQNFERTGGSSGLSRTPWPTSNREWLAEQKRDPIWQDIIVEMETEFLSLQEARLQNQQANRVQESNSSNSSSELREVTPQEPEELIVERTYKGLHLVFNCVLLVKQPTYDHNEHRLLLVVPESLQRNVMELYHDSKGHPGAARTKETIHLYYWWKGMSYMVTQHIYGCKACARRKARNAVAATPVQAYKAPGMPWERVHIDLTGPLTESSKGNKYIVVVKDALTRYVEAIPIKNKTADEVVHAFITAIIYRHGAVGWLISDNGREFVNKFFAQVAQLLNIKHTTITEYNPRANGLAENHMRTMKDALSIYCDETQKDWDDHLGGVSMSYNTTVNSQTGFTPFHMLYGHEARLPSEAWMKGFQSTSGVLPYVIQLVKSLTTLWETAASQKPAELKRMRDGQKPVRHLQFAEYKVGDYAMVANTPKSQTVGWVDAKFRKLTLKLQPRYSGPYIISKQISPVVYVLKVDGFDKKVHAVNMKPFTGKKSILTPYVEPGMDRYEANERVVPKPLLLSPDATLNEATRVKFQKKSGGRLRLHTEALNSKEARELREFETRENMSASQEAEYLRERDLAIDLYEDYEEQSDDREIRDYPRSSSSSHSGLTSNITSDLGVDEYEANMLHLECQEEPSTVYWENDFQQRTQDTSGWEKAMDERKRISRNRILRTAGIPETDLESNTNMKERIELWIDDLTMNEQSRCSRLSRSQLRKENFYNSMEERIGLQLMGLEQQWRKKPAIQHSQSMFDRMNHTSNIGTPLPIKSKCSDLQEDVIPEISTSSRISMNDCETVLEECNLLSVEVQSDNEASIDPLESNDDDMSFSSEDSFDREKWHRSVLKACTQHASRLDLSSYEPIWFGFDVQNTHKLRVELDAEIPIPVEYRALWYQLQSDIRKYGTTGLLLPTVNTKLESWEHWRNMSKQNFRNVPHNIYLRILSLPASIMRVLFHPSCRGRIILGTATPQQVNLSSRNELHRKYDTWYWRAMKIARRMEMEPSSPRRAYSKLKGHSRKEASQMTNAEWRAHHYFMWDAIQRNKVLKEPPPVINREEIRC